MTDANKDFPHHPAAFINAIREDGTKDEACEWLQKIWNERCSIAAERDALKAKQEQARADALREAVKKIRNAPAWKFYSYAERDRVADVVEALIDKETDHG